ncbi:phage portal protein [Pararhizobium haloflavum]|uniref:phage portal protein n=1 Tax=Pararhizobium haloflavum TaxID=2037914 RepID=UPI003521D715
MTRGLPWRKRRPSAQAPAETKMATSGFVALHAAGGANWTLKTYPTLARAGYMRNPVAHRCVRLICEAAAAVPWLVYEGRREHDAHPILTLLAAPSPRHCGPEFLETLYGHLLLSGNAFAEAVWVDGALRELHPLRPDTVRPVEGEEGWPLGHDHTSRGRTRRIVAGHAGEGGLMHLRLFHPLDDHMGFPPLEAASMALDLHNQAAQWNKALLDNSARPSGALVYQPKEGGNLSDEQYERLKEELEDGYSGARRAGRPLLLEGGLDWKAMGLTPREMDFVEAKNGAARDIALAFGVPPMMLGIPGDNTYANYQEANRAFYRLTVMPLLSRTCAAFTQWLGPAFGSDLRLDFDTDAIAGLAMERDAQWRRLNEATFLSEDEKREAVGYQPVGA